MSDEIINGPFPAITDVEATGAYGAEIPHPFAVHLRIELLNDEKMSHVEYVIDPSLALKIGERMMEAARIALRAKAASQ